jgi:hypothetical protein
MNKYTATEQVTLFRNRLRALFRKLNVAETGNATYQTREQLVGAVNKALATFFKSPSSPLFDPRKIKPNMSPDTEAFNDEWRDLKDDLDTIFLELEQLGNVQLSTFNYLVSESNNLFGKVKKTSDLLGTLALYSQFGVSGAVLLSDSFSSFAKIDAKSSLLSKDELDVATDEGIVTLPINRATDSLVTAQETPTVNSNSNGIPGNNQQVGATLRGAIDDILDNKADTWFEYERVLSKDDGVPLVLDFTINIGDPKIINFIRINPNNFGVKTNIEILAIDTSSDGKEFTSIKKDILPTAFAKEDNDFLLAPTTSKYAGQGLFSFTPRKTQYVRVSLRQSTPYKITTVSGSKDRYAIGIRDIHLRGRQYKVEGEIISKALAPGDDVRKVALLSNQSEKENSTLATVEHHVSPDDGVTWYQIRPRGTAGKAGVSKQKIPEVLDFNGSIADTVKTSSSVSSLRYRLRMKRNNSTFTKGAKALGTTEKTTSELHSPPLTTPFSITLQHTPKKDSIKIVDAGFGSRGVEGQEYLVTASPGGSSVLTLPWRPIPRNLSKSLSGGDYVLDEVAPQTVKVNGEEWTHSSLSGAGATDKVYQIDFERATITTGDGTNGMALPADSVVSVEFDEETLYPSNDTSHTAELAFPAPMDKEQTTIEIQHPAKQKVFVLKKNAKIHKLLPDMSLVGIVFSDSSVFDRYNAFVDGSTELTTIGDWSIDLEKGVAYTYTATNSTTDTTCHFWYNPRTILDADDWDFVEHKSGAGTRISLKKWQSFEIDEPETIPTGLRYFNLANTNVVPGTIKLTSASNFTREVDFVDGRTELLGVLKTSQQVPLITETTPTDLKVPLWLQVSSLTTLPVTFSNTDVFATELAYPGPLVSVGDYYIDRTPGDPAVYVRVDSPVSYPGTVSYFFNNPNAQLTGAYSVDYTRGEIYLYDVTPASATVTYEYTDYRAKYPIARAVSSNDWDVDTNSKKVSFKDSEIMKSQSINQLLSSRATRYYQVSYRYKSTPRLDADELAPYYTPVVKDYALKVITKKGMLVE